MDPSGDFMPYVLRDEASSPVVNAGLKERVPKGCQTLGPALDYWLYHLRTGRFTEGQASDKELQVSNTAEFVVQCEIRSPVGTGTFSIADSGFGYSQVLPILIRGLLVPKGGTLIVEQPELHLNPALQLRLAAFFVAMVRAGKQVILETHSEHIVNAVRVLAGEDESAEIAKATSIYFFGLDGGKLSIMEMSVLPDGTVRDWPLEFFGEAAQLAGRLLRVQRRYLQLGKL
jgi:predicted ATPase